MKVIFVVCKVLFFILAVLFVALAFIEPSAAVFAIVCLVLGIILKPEKAAKQTQKEIEANRSSGHKPLSPLLHLDTAQSKASSRTQVQQRIAENAAAGIACCPKCGSTSLTVSKKGFSVGKAAAGMLVFSHPAGGIVGGIGANKLKITCLNCGHTFKARKK